MRVRCGLLCAFNAGILTILLVLANVAWGQASYTAQVRGTVKDQSGALVTQATVTITNDATGIPATATTDDHGMYILTGLRPAVYTIKAEREGFRTPSFFRYTAFAFAVMLPAHLVTTLALALLDR